MKNNKYLFISVKPIYAQKILSREKSIELRKLKPKVSPGDYIIIYASEPQKAVVGFGLIKRVIVTTPQEMWNSHSKNLGIDKKSFGDYYAGKSKAVGIVIDSVRSLTIPIPLSKLRGIDASFAPPQVYRYVTNRQICDVFTNIIEEI